MLPRDNIVHKSKGTMMGLIGAYQDLEGSPPKQPMKPSVSSMNPQRKAGSTAQIPTPSKPQPKPYQPVVSKGQPQFGGFGSKPVTIGGAPQASASKGFLAKPTAPAQPNTKMAPTPVKALSASNIIREAVQRFYGASDVNLQALLAGGYQKFAFADRPNLQLYDFSDPECKYTQKEVDNLVENEEQNFKLGYSILPIQKIYPNSKLTAQINPANLRQGRVGDCYILGSMAVVAQHSPNIQRLLEDETPDRASVLLCDSGVWKRIRLYKTVPVTDSGYPIFASPTSGEGNSWQMVLEKAFAIIYGGYDMLELGHSSTALRELTGCGTEYIDLDGAEAVWTKVSRFLAKGWAITGSSKTADQLPQGASISPKHCYAVLGAKQVTVPGKNTVARFIRLKNPLGSIDTPKKFAADIQTQLGEPNDGGGFWVTLGTLISEFEVLSCCRIERELLYSWHHVRNSGQKNNHCLFKLTCTQGSTVRLALNHHNLRHYKGALNLRTLKAMKYGVSRMVAFTKQGEAIRVLGYAFHSLQHISLEVEAKGFEEFYVWVNLDLVQTCLDKFTISASVLNAKTPVVIFRDKGAETALPKLKLLETLAQCWIFQPEAIQESDSRIYKPMALKQYSTNSRGTLTGLVRYYGQCLGYVMFVYKNEHPSVTLTETLTPKKLTNVELIYPQQKFPVKLSLPPGSSQVVVLQFGPDNNCSHESLIDSYSEFSG